MVNPPVISAPVYRGPVVGSTGLVGAVQSFYNSTIPSEGADLACVGYGIPSECADQAYGWITYPSDGADQAFNWTVVSYGIPSEGAAL